MIWHSLAHGCCTFLNFYSDLMYTFLILFLIYFLWFHFAVSYVNQQLLTCVSCTRHNVCHCLLPVFYGTTFCIFINDCKCWYDNKMYISHVNVTEHRLEWKDRLYFKVWGNADKSLWETMSYRFWHTYFVQYTPPWVEHTSYSSALASLNYLGKMLKVGLQTIHRLQTWHPQWSKILSPADVFQSLGTIGSLKGPDS